jgi:signal transduction histidine kinase
MVTILAAGASMLAALRWEFPWHEIHLYTLASFELRSLLTVFVFFALICFAIVMVAFLLGRRFHDVYASRQLRIQVRNERTQSEEVRREQEAAVTEARVRNEIARELHDVVSHSLSVMVVQANGGRALVRKRPEAAEAALDTIAETGRQALTDMRRIVGVLRDDPSGETAEYAPKPGLADIPELVQHAGDRASFEVYGQLPEVPDGIGLIAYRVVQEALTNSLKHAGDDAHIWVRMDYFAQGILIEVRDNGLGAAVVSDGKGNGLRGMDERVSSLRGQLQTGPLPGGGYQVRAWLPLPRYTYQTQDSGLIPRIPAPGQEDAVTTVLPRLDPGAEQAGADDSTQK